MKLIPVEENRTSFEGMETFRRYLYDSPEDEVELLEIFTELNTELADVSNDLEVTTEELKYVKSDLKERQTEMRRLIGSIKRTKKPLDKEMLLIQLQRISDDL